MEYQIELLETTVKKLNISVGMKGTTAFQVEGQTTATVFEPTDDNDPTVMIQTKSTLQSADREQLLITIEAEFIFKFDPIPENRIESASELCPDIINQKLNQLSATFVRDMGHEFAMGQ